MKARILAACLLSVVILAAGCSKSSEPQANMSGKAAQGASAPSVGMNAAGVQAAAFGERDQFLHFGLDRLGLRLAGFDPLVLDQLFREVREQRLAVGGVAAELVPLLFVPHLFLRPLPCA